MKATLQRLRAIHHSLSSDWANVATMPAARSRNRPRAVLRVEQLEGREMLSELHVGAGQPYSTIQSAADAVQPGDSIVVHDGTYTGFELATSGTAAAPITVRTQGNVTINQPGRTGSGIRLTNVNYVSIDGFQIRDISGSDPGGGISARGATATQPMQGLIVRNNTVVHCSKSGIYLSHVNSSLIEGNTISGSGVEHGIYLANAGSDNTTIRGNVVFDNTGAGIHFNGDASVGGDGIISGLQVENNVIYGNGQNGLNMDGVRDSLVQNNLVYGNGRHALRGYQIDAAAGPRNMKIIHNTFVAATGSSIKLTEDGGGGHVIFNNILLADGADGPLFVQGSFVAAANLQDGTSAAAGLFVNAAAGDYHLKAGSRAIDAGVSELSGVLAPLVDFEGTVRPQGAAPDQGADELGAASDNAPPTLDAIPDQTINENAAAQTVNLTGITAGGGESQALSVSASSNNTGLVPNPTVTYSSPDTTGSLSYTPVADQAGTATVTVTVRDAGLDGTLGNGDDATFSRAFVVTVNANPSIQIVVEAVPGSAQDFEFDPSSNLQAANFFLDHDSDATLSNTQRFKLPAGDYAVQQVNMPAGWLLTTLTCTGGGSNTSTTLNTRTASIGLDAGEMVTCTYRNAFAVLYLALISGSSVSSNISGTLSVANEDIIAFDGSKYSMILDGSDVGLGSFTLDAFAILSSNEILMSFTSDINQCSACPGWPAGGVDDSDLVKFTATSLGPTSAGSFVMYFDGSDVGLTTSSEDVDAVELLSNGHLLLSTRGAFSVPGPPGTTVSGGDKHLIEFTASSLGTNTAGTFAIYFDGSDVGLTTSDEDVDAVALDSSGTIYLSTVGNFSAQGTGGPSISGADEDVFLFSATSTGTTTTGSYSTPLFFDGSVFELGANDIVAIDLPASSSSLLAGSRGASNSDRVRTTRPAHNSIGTVQPGEIRLGQITLIVGWNWYSGSDPSAIAPDQYDYQAIITHELAHGLLGHSADAGSVLYPALSPGVARPDLTAHDLALLASEDKHEPISPLGLLLETALATKSKLAFLATL